MVNYLKRLETDPAQQWAVVFGLGFFTWFAIICFARILPAPLQLLTMLIPIALFTYALWILPRWQKQGRRRDLAESLSEREFNHAAMLRHQINLKSIDAEFLATARELDELYDDASPGATPHAQLEAPEQNGYLLKVQQEVMQSCGDLGWHFIEYVSGKGKGSADKEGWISIEKLRSNWGRNLNLNTEQMRHLMSALVQIQVGEWRDSTLTEWRLLLTL